MTMNVLVALMFLFLKTGEKFATQETAGPTVAEFLRHVGPDWEPQVMNDPVKAAEWCGAHKPALGIVTPGFYFAYTKTLGMEPLLETRREQIAEERYVLVAKKDAGDKLDDYAGKTIATGLAAEQHYVLGVILQNKLGDETRLKVAPDIEGAVFDLIEGAKDAGAAVLMEEVAWKIFQADEELGGKLKAIYRSDELPRDLVVSFGSADTGKAREALKALAGSEDGKKILHGIRVESFDEINAERFEKARKLFYGK